MANKKKYFFKSKYLQANKLVFSKRSNTLLQYKRGCYAKSKSNLKYINKLPDREFLALDKTIRNMWLFTGIIGFILVLLILLYFPFNVLSVLKSII